jgi:hypothetical protein
MSAPDYRYSVSASSLDQVDFKNLRVFFQPGDPSDRGVALRKGKFRKHLQGGYEEVSLESVEFFKSQSGNEQFALISLYWMDCGGSCTTLGKIQVFALREGHPRIIQQIEYDRHAEGTSDSFKPWNGHLVIVGRGNDDSAKLLSQTLGDCET